MNLNKLTDEALDEFVDTLAEGIKDLDRERKIATLDCFVTEMDYGDQDDYYGTEGWRHLFGVED